MAVELSERLEDRLERLMASYAESIDEGRLEEWPSYFTEDCLYRIVTRDGYRNQWPAGIMHCEGRGMVSDRVLSLRRANIYEAQIYRHLTSGMRIKGEEKRGWRVHTNLAVIRTMRTGEMIVFVAGFYDDLVAEVGGKLLYRERTVVLDSERIDTLLAIPV